MSSLLDSVSLAPTCSEGEEESLVRMVLQQRLHSPPHPLIPLVDQFLSEVAVYFLCGHLLAGRQSHVVEVWDLREKGVTVESRQDGWQTKLETREGKKVFPVIDHLD